MARLTTSEAGLKLIAAFEGFRATSVRLRDGRWTVGYGSAHVADAAVSVTRAEAKALLQADLAPIEAFLNDGAFAPLSQSQFDALASFAFNIGLPAFEKSAVLAHLNRGEPIAAALAMDAWRSAEIAGDVRVVDALVRRRASEKALFLAVDDEAATAATPLLTPKAVAVSDTIMPEAMHQWVEEVEPAATPSPEPEAFIVPAAQPAQDPATDVPSEPSSLPETEPVSPQEKAAAALGTRLERLVGPAADTDQAGQPEADAMPEAVPDSAPEPAPAPALPAAPEPMVEPVEPVEPVEVIATTEQTGVATASNVAEAIVPPPFPAETRIANDHEPRDPVQLATEAVGPISDPAEPVEVIAAQPVAPEATKPKASVEEAAVPARQSRIVQALIVIGGLAMILWSMTQAGISPSFGTPSPQVAVLLAIAGVCFIVVGGYFLIRPPKPD